MVRNTRSLGIALVCLALAVLLAQLPAWADEAAPPPYTGGIITETSTLTGDWRGYRNEVAAKGVTLDASVTQIEQGVVSGGKDSQWEYGGRGILTGKLDTQKAGLWPGGFLTVKLEGNWADSVNPNTGALSPANTNALFPVPGGSNVGLPELSFAQFLSPYAGITLGKMETTVGDANEFAHGKGDKQFFNLAFNLNPALLTVTPYSTLAGGVIVLPNKDPDAAILNFLVLSATGSATTAGFDELSGDNLTFAASGRVRTNFFDLTGHQLLAAEYSNKTYTSLDQRLDFIIGNRALAPKTDSWDVYYNFDQFLYETDKSRGHGLGVFGRFAASDGNPNPVHYFVSIGLGSKALIPGRTLDQFGIGFYYMWVANPTLQGPLMTREFLGDEWGLEAYYNVAVLPWLLLTPDIQLIDPAQRREFVAIGDQRSIGKAVVLGVRLQVVI